MKKFFDQPTAVQQAYREYVDAKQSIEEKPLIFKEWAKLEKEIGSPIGAIIE